jgi:hypothetical protein
MHHAMADSGKKSIDELEPQYDDEERAVADMLRVVREKKECMAKAHQEMDERQKAKEAKERHKAKESERERTAEEARKAEEAKWARKAEESWKAEVARVAKEKVNKDEAKRIWAMQEALKEGTLAIKADKTRAAEETAWSNMQAQVKH